MQSGKFHHRSVAEGFGSLLREVRLRVGLTQEQLADRSALHRTTIGLLERGLRTPSLDTFLRLCWALDVKPEDFVRSLASSLEATGGG